MTFYVPLAVTAPGRGSHCRGKGDAVDSTVTLSSSSALRMAVTPATARSDLSAADMGGILGYRELRERVASNHAASTLAAEDPLGAMPARRSSSAITSPLCTRWVRACRSSVKTKRGKAGGGVFGAGRGKYREGL
jgi:hypothetical protein